MRRAMTKERRDSSHSKYEIFHFCTSTFECDLKKKPFSLLLKIALVERDENQRVNVLEVDMFSNGSKWYKSLKKLKFRPYNIMFTPIQLVARWKAIYAI